MAKITILYNISKLFKKKVQYYALPASIVTAKAVNQRHGWKEATEIRQKRIAEVTKACMDVLRSMPFFDWDEYADRLKAKGYDIELIRGKAGQGRVHGYRFKFGRTTTIRRRAVQTAPPSVVKRPSLHTGK